ncbi:MAG: S41 family peptidase [Bacteroidota bacterium]
MKAIFNRRNLILALMVTGLLINQGCKKEPTETQIITNWIWDGMNEVYLWEDQIPKYNPDKETDPEAFFYKLLYVDDSWSWITDDYEALVNSFNGIELSTGIYPQFGRLEGSDDVIMVVAYVNEGSPADLAGVKRGDIIYAIDGQNLNIDNYIDLYYSVTAVYSFADFTGSAIVPNGTELTLTVAVIEQNPILYSQVINYEGKTIGYLAYAQFTAGEADVWMDELNSVLLSFKSESVDEVVIDLRYNPGGSVDVAQWLASALAPADVMNNNEILMNLNWNKLYNDYFLQEYGEESDYLRVRFTDNPYNLGLDKVYFMTTGRSASACELLISGLDPWTNVIHIGESTYGKYTGSITIPDTEDPPRHNWAMQPIVFKYSNAVGYTDFKDGLTPDYVVDDDLLTAVPFGDLSDPQLSKALELITGVAPSKKAATVGLRLDRMPEPFLDKKVSEINSLKLPLKPGSLQLR